MSNEPQTRAELERDIIDLLELLTSEQLEDLDQHVQQMITDDPLQ